MIFDYDLTRTASAAFSPCRRYRYTLRRCFRGTVDDPPRNPLIWAMANPSTADAFRLDPTLKRCAAWTQVWGYSDMIIVNCFALRSPDPRALLASPDPMGSENEDAIASLPHGLAIVAWGNFSAVCERAPAMARLLARPLLCLATNADGSPRHPLSRGKGRIPDDVRPVPWAPKRDQ